MLRKKLLLVISVAAAGLWLSAGNAAAQSADVADRDQAPIVLAQSNSGGLFKSLFGKRRKVKRGRDVRKEQQRQKKTKRRRKKKSVTAGAASAAKPPVIVEKKTDARTVLVVGDFMANGLGKGLVDALVANSDIQVVNASNGSSGLVRDDYYDWNAAVPALVAEHNANLILVMIGANDRQPIRSGGKQIEVSNEAWRPAYDARVTAFAEVLAGQGIPVLWLGLAPVSKASLSRDYSVFNTLFRQKADLKGFKFVDIWNGFADEKGQYVARGPDINGQTRSLRGKGGLSFTTAGRRKLAFFVERDVVKILSDDQAAVFAALPGGSGTPGVAVPAISPMLPIETISIKPGSELSAAPLPAADPEPAKDEEAQILTTDSELTMAETSGELAGAENAELAPDTNAAANRSGEIPNRPLSSPAGRADDFTWPAPQ